MLLRQTPFFATNKANTPVFCPWQPKLLFLVSQRFLLNVMLQKKSPKSRGFIVISYKRSLFVRERTQFCLNHYVETERRSSVDQALRKEPQHTIADFPKGRSDESRYAQPHTGGQHRHSRITSNLHTAYFLTTDFTDFSVFFNIDCFFLRQRISRISRILAA